MIVPLPTRMVEKPWGRDALPEPFAAPAGQRIGEIWFQPPAELPELLVKYIFTSEPLSVQVHPSDAQRPDEGKEECWLVTSAQPGAKLGIGLHAPADAATLRAAALDGSIEQLLAWHDVQAGDFFTIPANTIHAIGAGIGLVEVQQNSDTTYRLYDYGRPRELHLDDAIAVARAEPYPAALRRTLPERGAAVLVDGPVFHLTWLGSTGQRRLPAGRGLVVPLHGEIRWDDTVLAPGTCAFAADSGVLTVAEGASCLIVEPCGS